MTARDPNSAIVILSGRRMKRAEGGEMTVVSVGGFALPADVHDILFAQALARSCSVEEVAAEKLIGAVRVRSRTAQAGEASRS